MSKQFKFTTARLSALPPNPPDSRSTEAEYSDTDVTGLKCLVGKSGTKRFLLRYVFQKRKCSIAIGKYPDVDLTTARKVARQHKSTLAEGIDPKAERDKVSEFPTVRAFFYDAYLPLAQKRKKSWKDDEHRFRLHCSEIFHLPYNQLTAQHVLSIQLKMYSDSKERPAYKAATCNRVLALLKVMGKLAEQLLELPNVAKRVSLLPENNARTRYCTPEECRKIIEVSLAYLNRSIGGFIALLFLTGCRASELRNRVWRDVDFKRRILTIPNTKNGSEHQIYLTDIMLEILRNLPRDKGNPHLFIGRTPGHPLKDIRIAFDKIKEAAGIINPDEVLLHTARHSVASNLISNGVDISTVQKLLNHRSIESTLRYAKLSEQHQRDTLQNLSDLIVGHKQ